MYNKGIIRENANHIGMYIIECVITKYQLYSRSTADALEKLKTVEKCFNVSFVRI